MGITNHESYECETWPVPQDALNMSQKEKTGQQKLLSSFYMQTLTVMKYAGEEFTSFPSEKRGPNQNKFPP
jgi:hypothetical protein